MLSEKLFHEQKFISVWYSFSTDENVGYFFCENTNERTVTVDRELCKQMIEYVFWLQQNGVTGHTKYKTSLNDDINWPSRSLGFLKTSITPQQLHN